MLIDNIIVINIVVFWQKGENITMKEKNITYNVHGGQLNIASDNATINAIQNNDISVKELDIIIKGIMDNLSDLKEEDADEIKDIVDMAKEELSKPEPKTSRLRNCVTLIAPMITIVNGIPILASNLQKLVDYIAPYIR